MFSKSFNKKHKDRFVKRSTLNSNAMQLLFPEIFTHKKRYITHNFESFFIVFDFITILGLYYYIAYLLLDAPNHNLTDSYYHFILEGFFLCCGVIVFLKHHRVYKIDEVHDWFAKIYTLSKSLLFSFIFIKSVFLLLKNFMDINTFLGEHLSLIFMFLGILVFCLHIGYLNLYRLLVLSNRIYTNAILLGTEEEILNLLKQIKKIDNFAYNLTAYYPTNKPSKRNANNELRKLTRINNLIELKRMRLTFDTCSVIYCVPHHDYKHTIENISLVQKFISHCNHIICYTGNETYTLRSCNVQTAKYYQTLYKKGQNFVFASLLLALTFPILIITYLACIIKNTSKPICKEKIHFTNGHYFYYNTFNLSPQHILKNNFIDKLCNLHHVMRCQINFFGPSFEEQSIDNITPGNHRNELKEIFYSFSIQPGLFGWRSLIKKHDSSINSCMQAELRHILNIPNYLNILDLLKISRKKIIYQPQQEN